MDIFFTKPSGRIGRDELRFKALKAMREVVTGDTEFEIRFFNPNNLDDNSVEVVIDIPAKFYNPDNKKCYFKFNHEELTPEHIAETFGNRSATSLFLNDEWYSRINKRTRENAVQDALTDTSLCGWGIRDDVFRSN